MLGVGMGDYADRIHAELSQAFPVADESALKRASSLLAQRQSDSPIYPGERSQIHSELRVLSETTRQFMMFTERRFDQLDKRIDQVEVRIDQVDKRIDQVEQRIDQVDKRIDQVELRIVQIDKRIDQVELRIDQIDKRIDQVDKRIDQIERRFEAFETRFVTIDQRFGRTHTLMMSGFSMLAILMSIFEFIA